MFSMRLFLLICISLCIGYGSARGLKVGKGLNYFKKGVDDDPGEPLFLTPYIKNGQIEQGTIIVIITLISEMQKFTVLYLQVLGYKYYNFTLTTILCIYYYSASLNLVSCSPYPNWK